MGNAGRRKISLIAFALSAFGLAGEARADGLRWPGEPSPWAPFFASPASGGGLSWDGPLGLSRPAPTGSRLGLSLDRRLAPGPYRWRTLGGSLGDPMESVAGAAALTPPSRDGWWWTAVPAHGAFGASRAGAVGGGPVYAYGAVLSAAREVSAGRRIGLGIAVIDSLDRPWAFPFLAVDWSLTERLRLTNPLVTGPVGLELKYRLSDAWEIGAGSAYRNARFPLDAAGFPPYGVGQERGVAAFLHLARSLGPRFNVDVYAGALLGGELRVENSAGVELYNEELAPSPVFGFSLTGRF